MLLLTLFACTTTELSQSWQIDRLRVLAVAADPAEPRPGDTVTFSSLVVSPDTAIAATIWFACLGGDDYGCTVDPDLLAGLEGGDDISPEELDALYAAGFIGAEPFLPPVWNVPADALDALTPAERLEGLTALVNVTAVPEGDDIDESDVELAYKRVPVSEATTPNHNPVVTGITVDGEVIPEGTTVTLDRGEPYTIAATLADDAVETYAFVNDAGETESRTEEPYLSWYLEEGTFDQEYGLYPYLDTTYYVPTDPVKDTGTLWVVVRDRRGGMGWATLPIRYR
jgi:hypothetical protein